MDERRDEALEEALPDEYSELGNPRLVMEEVVRLLADLHRASTRLGDTIVTAGLSARDWRGQSARLDHISDEFPPITLDELLTRIAEFSAGTGILWLRGGPAELDRFQDETVVLHGVIKPLRAFAQRQRMIPARDRGDEPLWKTFGDSLVSMPLDLVAKALSDLAALGSFLAPVSPDVWKAIEAEQAKLAPPPKPSSSGKSVKVAVAVPQPKPASPPTPPPPAPNGPPVGALTVEDLKPAAEQAPAPKRLREYLPSAPAVLPRAKESRLSRSLQAGGRYLLRRWIVVLTVTVMLALAIGLLAVVTQVRPRTTTNAHLTAAPSNLALACTGKTTSLSFTLKNTGSKTEAWKVTAPKGLALSALTGSLAPGATASLKATVASGTKTASNGSLTFTDTDGSLTIPYTISCS